MLMAVGIDHPFFRPKSIHNHEILDEYAKDYMYFACIRFINSVSLLFCPKIHGGIILTVVLDQVRIPTLALSDA